MIEARENKRWTGVGTKRTDGGLSLDRVEMEQEITSPSPEVEFVF